MVRSGTSAWADAIGRPGAMPMACAAALAPATVRRLPSCAAVIKGPPSAGAAPVLCSRSVGKVGNQTEMTLCITCLHDPGCGFAAAAADEIEAPERGCEA